MDTKEEFKKFVSDNPRLIEYVRSKKNTWQEFYELYDLYKDDKNVWDKYLAKDEPNTDDRASSLAELASLVKNINMDNVQKYINNAQKAINVIQELTTKNPVKNEPIVPKSPRPITKFFGD